MNHVTNGDPFDPWLGLPLASIYYSSTRPSTLTSTRVLVNTGSTLIRGSWNYAPKFFKLCATILKIMRALFTIYAYIMRTFIGFVLHTFVIQHRQCDISGVILSSVPSVVNNSDVMLLSDWLLLSHLPVLTTATSSLGVSWCPVHISATAISPLSFMWQHILYWTWSHTITSSALRELHWLPVTARI